jgi:glycosyltransferase involved in cell wall biosynthesis
MLTYNRENLVGNMIESILAQTFRDFEFVIVDNGSTDRSGAVADEYAESDARIWVIHKERGNIGSGRNAGLDAIRGEYIAFIDDDDWLETDYLQFLLNLIEENDADIAMCSAAGREYDEKFVMTAEDAMIKLLWRKYFNVQFPTKLIRRRLFDGVRFSEAAKYDDIELFPRILANAKKIAYHGLAKYTFDRGHGSNNSAWTTNHKLISTDILTEYLTTYRERTKWLCEIFPNSAAAWRYFEWSFMISMIEIVTRLELADCYAIRNMLVRELQTHRDEFVNSEYILDFEKEWMGKYV